MREVELPPIGTVISVPLEITQPAATCIHDLAQRWMCTIIPTEHRPDPEAHGPWILSCWGNGPGIVCFLEDWDRKPFYDIEVVQVNEKSVIGVPLKASITQGG